MPVTKVPITHKFGIISLSHRDELQSRLLKDTRKSLSPTQHQPLRNPLDLSDDFIRKFNLTSDLDERERLEDEAKKLLARAKRRAGLKDGGRGNFIDIPKAWSELSMLAQCRGRVQEECLDTLIISLHQAPLSLSHIPCLFYLAETTLYWLRTDAMNQPFLRIGEIKLLKMGYATFLCLFYHHMAGHLHPHGELKDRLATYLAAILDGFEESEEVYLPYPGSHLCLKFIASVGKMIVGEALMDNSEGLHQTETNSTLQVEGNKAFRMTPVSPVGKPLSRAEQQTLGESDTREPTATQSNSIHDLSPTLWHALDVWRCADHLGEGLQEASRALSLCGCRIATEHWVDASCALRVIGETALGSLPVLRAFQNLARGVLPKPKGMVKDKIQPDQRARQEDDLISMESFETSKRSVASLGSMEIMFEEMLRVKDHRSERGQEACRPVQSEVPSQAQEQSNTSHLSQRQFVTGNTSMLANLDTPMHERGFGSSSPVGTRHSHEASSNYSIPDISSCNESQLGSAGCLRQHWSEGYHGDEADSNLALGNDGHAGNLGINVTRQGAGFPPAVTHEPKGAASSQHAINLPKTKSSLKGRVGEVWHGNATTFTNKSVIKDPGPGTNVYSSERSQQRSEEVNSNMTRLSTRSNQATNHYGMTNWPWEVAYIYTEVLTGVCLYGGTANIKKAALIGTRTGIDVMRTKKTGSCDGGNKLSSAGLLDLAEIEKSTKNEEDDWSWRVRYAAITGLVKISRACQRDKALDGMGNVVWNALMIRHSQERDARVMEAFRVGQVDAQLECEMQRMVTGLSLTFKLAAGLAATYLPPLSAPVQHSKCKPVPRVELPKPSQHISRGPARPSLRQELQLATSLTHPQASFYTRTDLDLKRIVEDQWRKELQEQLEEEERERQRELDKTNNPGGSEAKTDRTEPETE